VPELPALPDPAPTSDQSELLLAWLGLQRDSVLRKLADLDETRARWTPDGALLPILGIVNHLTHVEWRWTAGMLLGEPTSRSAAEFRPGPELTVAEAVLRYRAGPGDRPPGAHAALGTADDRRQRPGPALGAAAPDRGDGAARPTRRRDP
jgi:hypothetical protein